MFTLILVACINMRACEYRTVTIDVATEAACARQAALIAGMVRGRYPHAGRDLTYEFVCRPEPPPARMERADR